MADETVQNKIFLRRKIRADLETMAVDKNHGISLLEHLRQLDKYGKASTIFCYLSTEKEPDTWPIVEDILKREKKLCVPRCLKHGIMEACEIKGIENLVRGRLNILEPGQSCPVIPKEDIDLAIIPCMAVNAEGYRLGKGGGYYDRYLTGTRMVRVVLCWERFSDCRFPAGAHDVAMDYMITERFGRKI